MSFLVKGAAEGLGMAAVLKDFGREVRVEIHSDATGAIGIAGRQGLGKIRHIAVADLWVQQRVKTGELKTFKVPGDENSSDMMTKALEGPRIAKLLDLINVVRFREGD